ncbi:trehalose-6-phosphate synthase, putative [Perkinsus marinus ATCC 50983]|uniref:Trehalose-6-phosphate synthase, putative n=1 Tax=Perkinsus marinus (strain ATCC 50983 / TXsc) TaxID=423536 RepID=C5LYK8_PERM5|nr:trehalose-6-phosphate synthase, putative [Perkinsus marinus ATCC 50983]EEQ98246.1 trehalose-6-phosphate synthase, putative [Perkinsus marinus ATCC 50983]|eukprot:XP_002765529.1 trehalose-6-phosphate synthase, putative [Perkinsus marinus ATCC 50983]
MRVTEYAYATVGPSGNLKSWERTDAGQRVIPSGMEMTIEDDDGLYRYLLSRGGAAARPQHTDTTTASGASSAGAADSASLESGGRDASSGELHVSLRPSGPSQESLPRVRSASFDASITLTPDDCVVFVSIQLPVLVCRKAGGGFEVYPSRYVSMSTLHAVKNELNPNRSLFVGWPGLDYLSKEEQEEVRKVLLPYDCIPVFSSDPQPKRRGPQPARHGFEEFLDFCQTFLWPTVNDQVPLVHNSEDLMTFDNKLWEKYRNANQRYVDVLLNADLFPTLPNFGEYVYWVNDYHLLLVPMLLRRGLRRSQRGPSSPTLSPAGSSSSSGSPPKKATIGLFVHTPFPTSEIFLTLPVRTQVMQSLLAADLVGFQFFDYARHFLTVVKKLVGLDMSYRLSDGYLALDVPYSYVLVTVGHASTQFELIAAQMRSPEVLRRIKELKAKFAGKTIICGVDRLGRLSGILLKLRTFRQFLKVYPAYRNKVVLVQLAVSRTTTTHTSPENRITLSKRISALAKEINDSMGPHVFFYAGDIGTEDRLATMAVSDMLLDTSLKDGLNLAPFEYLSARYAMSLNVDEDPTASPRCVLDQQGALLGRSSALMSHGNPPSAAVLDALSKLCSDPRNTVVILSGREKSLLQEWFGSVRNIGLAAEHGYYWKLPPNTEWKALAGELMRQYVSRTQNSFVENKGSALVWQFRDTDPDFGLHQAKNLYSSLEEYLKGYDVEVTMGKGYVEAKLRGVNKGLAVQTILAELATSGNGQSPDFVMCIGDDRSDEYMFEALNSMSVSLTAHPDSLEHAQFVPGVGIVRSSGVERESSSEEESGPQRTESTPATGPVSAENTFTQRMWMRYSSRATRASRASDPSSGVVGQGRMLKKKKSPSRLSKNKEVYCKYTVTVGRKSGSQAHYYVHDVHAVTDLLGRLADETMFPRQEASEVDGRSSAVAAQMYAVHNASTVPAGSSKDFEEKPPHELEEPTIVEGPEEEPSSPSRPPIWQIKFPSLDSSQSANDESAV